MSFPHGFLIFDKPQGVTSFSMVSLARRLTGVRRVGHAGTLDPLATGVLPVAIGQAARFIEYLDDAKIYEASVHFGISTDTYDAEGTVTSRADASSLSRYAIELALTSFIGEITQIPPVYSAVKVAGKPLYRYAREGVPVAIRPRVVRIDAIDLRSFEAGTATIVVRCGKGTYIRSLAHDLGQALGCGAHLTGLRRTRSGGFEIRDARSPDELTASAGSGTLESLLLAPDRAVEHRPAAILGPRRADQVRSGGNIVLAASATDTLCRIYSTEGEFVGLVRSQGLGTWHPEKVVAGG